MSKAIFIEPTCACFELSYNNSNYSNNEIMNFINQLNQIYGVMQKNNLKLILTYGLKIHYENYLPYCKDRNLYENPRIFKLCVLIQQRFKHLVKYEKLPDFYTNIVSDQVAISNIELLTDDIYVMFQNLLGLSFNDKSLNNIVKGSMKSVFTNENTIIQNQTKKTKSINIIKSMDELQRSKIVLESKLIRKYKPGSMKVNTIVKTDGDHHNIYNKKIRGISDIPKPDKRLLEMLIKSGKLLEIHFTEHIKGEKKKYPYIKVIGIDKYNDVEILRGKLVSGFDGGNKGKNGQCVQLKFIAGIAKYISRYCDNEITSYKLDKILQQV